MPAVTLVSPLLLGKQEAWRRFCQKLLEARRDEHQEFCKRLGITKEQVWLAQTPQMDIVIVHLEAEHPERMLPSLIASNHSFDRWFRRQFLDLHGFELAQLSAGMPNELIFAWQTP